MKEFKKEDLGLITFGKFKGFHWNAPCITDNYLQYIISEECNTSLENKEIAKKALLQNKICDGKLEMF